MGPNATMEDEHIITQILEGNIGLYEIIVRRYNPYLYKIGRTYGYSHEDTEDLMQETFINTYKSLSKFEHKALFKTWITRIMLNNCYHKRLKKSDQMMVDQEVQENSTPIFSNQMRSTEKMVNSHELRKIIELALSEIPLAYRMVFALREMNGMNTKETAELLEISEANVKVRLNRAKKMLRESIEKSYAPQELHEFNLIHCDPMVNRVMEKIQD